MMPSFPNSWWRAGPHFPPLCFSVGVNNSEQWFTQHWQCTGTTCSLGELGIAKGIVIPFHTRMTRHTYNKIHFIHIVLAILKVTVEPKWSSSVGVAIRLDVWRKPLKSLYFQGRFGRIWERGRDQHRYVFSAPFSRKRCGEISIICLVCFWHAVKL